MGVGVADQYTTDQHKKIVILSQIQRRSKHEPDDTIGFAPVECKLFFDLADVDGKRFQRDRLQCRRLVICFSRSEHRRRF
jgi:hypothetical protein